MSAFDASEQYRPGPRQKGKGYRLLRNQSHRSGELSLRVRLQAQERAAELARRVPWQVLLEARNQYLEWQEFYYWARSIMESEGNIPDWLAQRLDEMCPGFVAAEKQCAAKRSKDAALAPVRLGEWIDEHIFGFAGQGGWLPAITFYAVRESRYQRASTCWSESVEKWRKTKPHEYPSFEQWLSAAAHCDESAHLLPEIRKQRECCKLVAAERLAEATSRYMDWEAFVYWARPALEETHCVVDEVARELDARCPGFREFNSRERTRDGELPRGWTRLMFWIRDHFFQEAKTEGWYDAIVISAGIHPRAIRTMEYADHCDDLWNGHLPRPYPSFENWRRDADRYVDLEVP
jgi:hypothetical protein